MSKPTLVQLIHQEINDSKYQGDSASQEALEIAVRVIVRASNPNAIDKRFRDIVFARFEPTCPDDVVKALLEVIKQGEEEGLYVLPKERKLNFVEEDDATAQL